MFGHKVCYEINNYIWWDFSQTLPNKLECCHKQCKCCCWWTCKSNNNLHLFNNWYYIVQHGFMCEINRCQLSMAMNGYVVFNEFMSIPSLVRSMQRTNFCAKSAKNNLKPTIFLKRNFMLKRSMSYVWTSFKEWACKKSLLVEMD